MKNQKDEAYIEAKHSELYERAMKKAKALGRGNLPSKDETDLGQYLGEIDAGYGELLAMFDKPTDTGEKVAELEHEAHTKRGEWLDGQLSKQKAELKTLNKERDEAEPVIMDSGRLGKKALVIALGFLDALLLRSALSIQQAENNMLQIGIFAGLVVMFCIAPKLLADVYRSFEKSASKWPYIAGAFIVVAGYCVAAYVRSLNVAHADLQTLDAATGGVSIPWYLMVILNLMFLYLAILAEYSLPTDQHKSKYMSQEKRERKIEKLERTISQMEEEKASMPGLALQTMRTKTEAAVRLAAYREKVQNCRLQTISAFKQTILEWRTDGCVPRSFSNPVNRL